MARRWQLLVQARADTKSARRELGRFGRSAKRTGADLTKTFTLPIALAGAGALKLGADAEETANKLNVTFGKKGVQRVTKDLDKFARATGASRYAMREQAATIGTLIKGMDLGAKATEDMTVNVVKLSKDLSSFHNVAENDALEKLRAGLTGEAEPLKQLGILLDEATVKQVAYAKGIAESGSELTQQQKVQARYLAIMEQAGKQGAVGDATDTAGSFSNQVKALTNELRDFATQIGRDLIPIGQRLVGWLRALSTRFSALDQGWRQVIIVSGLAVAALGPLVFTVGALATALSAVSLPVAGVVAGVVALGAAVATAYARHKGFRKLVRRVGGTLKAFVKRVARVVSRFRAWNERTDGVARSTKTLWRIIKVSPLGLFVRATLKMTRVLWGAQRRFDLVQNAVKALWAVLRWTPLGLLVRLIDKVVQKMGGWRRVGGRLATGLESAFEKIESATDTLFAAVDKLADGFAKVVDSLKWIAGKGGKALDTLSSVGGKLNPFGGAGHPMLGAAVGPVSGVDSFTPIARRMGLTMTSAYRPGDPGWHGQNRARDYSNGFGPTPQMLRFARTMVALYGSRLKELIYTPLGFGIKNGRRVPMSFFGDQVAAAHNNHVHVAYARGGVVTRPHLGLVGEAGPEAIVPLSRARRGDARRVMAQAGLGGDVTIHVGGSSGDPEAIAQRIAFRLRQRRVAGVV